LTDLSDRLREEGKCGVQRFKDASCGYDGEAGWCDRTKECCACLGNSERFDGVLPDVQQPWEFPMWDALCGLGLIATFTFNPSWWVAGPLYTIFSFLIVPSVRQELYYQCTLWRETRRELRNDSISKD
jgi:hypothetical protein